MGSKTAEGGAHRRSPECQGPVTKISRPSSNKRVRFTEGSESKSGVQTKGVVVQGSSGGTRYVVEHKLAVHGQWSFREDGRSDIRVVYRFVQDQQKHVKVKQVETKSEGDAVFDGETKR